MRSGVRSAFRNIQNQFSPEKKGLQWRRRRPEIHSVSICSCFFLFSFRSIFGRRGRFGCRAADLQGKIPKKVEKIRLLYYNNSRCAVQTDALLYHCMRESAPLEAFEIFRRRKKGTLYDNPQRNVYDRPENVGFLL